MTQRADSFTLLETIAGITEGRWTHVGDPA
jgi:hypothetical protein